jgi:hypothetical protein
MSDVHSYPEIANAQRKLENGLFQSAQLGEKRRRD